MDCNAKLGKEIIKGDPHDMSSNGKLLWDIIQRRDCMVVNASEKCQGVITRSRLKNGVKEASVIDYIIVNSMVTPYVDKMEIDESKMKALTRFKKGTTIPSDHNVLECTFNIPLQKRTSPRQEIYCLRNKTSLEMFRGQTTCTTKFSKCFSEKGDIQIEGKKWMKTLQKTIHTCFKKVRVTSKRRNNDEIQNQLDVRRKMKSDLKPGQNC